MEYRRGVALARPEQSDEEARIKHLPTASTDNGNRIRSIFQNLFKSNRKKRKKEIVPL